MKNVLVLLINTDIVAQVINVLILYRYLLPIIIMCLKARADIKCEGNVVGGEGNERRMCDIGTER